MAFARTIAASSTDLSNVNLNHYVNESRNVYQEFFVNRNFGDTYLRNSLTGIVDVGVQDGSLFLLSNSAQTSANNRVLYPANQHDLLSGTSFSDFSISNNILSAIPQKVQYLLHVSIEDQSNKFNAFSISLDDEKYTSLNLNFSDDEITLENQKKYTVHIFEPDIPQPFFIEPRHDSNGDPLPLSSIQDIFFQSQGGSVFCESDSISSSTGIYWLKGECKPLWTHSFSLGTQTTSAVPASSTMLEGNYVYNRIGNVQNEKNRNALVPRIKINNFFEIDREVSLSDVSKDKLIYEFTGNNYIQLNFNDPNYTYENELKTSMSFTTLFKRGLRGGQIIGNRNAGGTSGFSFSYNTGMHSFLKSIPFQNTLYSFNKDNLKNYEKSFGNGNISLIASGPSGSGIRWLLDNSNKEIHRLDIDNISLVKIVLLPTANIIHMETDFQNNLWIMDNNKKRFTCFDNNGKEKKTIPFLFYGNNKNWDSFHIPILGNDPIPTYALVHDFDSKGNLYRLVGNNIRKNNDILYSFGDTVQDFYVDLKDRVWVFYGANNIMLIDSETGFKIKEKQIIKSILSESNGRIAGWNQKGNQSAQVLFLDNNQILEIDGELNVIASNNISLTCQRNTGYSFRGDWTGFKIGKRQNYIDHTHFKGFASIETPFLTLDFSYYCNLENHDPIQHGSFRQHVPFRPFAKYDDWNGIGFVLNNHKGSLSFYINGSKVAGVPFMPMSRLIRHEYPDNNRYNPILIGAYNGKIGTIASHTGNEDEELIGKMANIYLYNSTLSDSQINTIFKDDMYQVFNRKLFFPLKVKIPTKQQCYFVKLKKFLKNSFPGIQSNFFDINVYGFKGTDNLKKRVEKILTERIDKVSPTHTNCRRINWK